MIASALAVLFLAAAPELSATTPVIGPEWVRRPDGKDMARAFPAAAQKEELEGFGTISCHVTGQGALADCAVIAEGPEGAGFGAAALQLSSLFKMLPVAKDGRPVEGGIVRVPIRFVLPPDVRSGPVAAHHPAYAGMTIEVSCRYRGQQLDNCRSSATGNLPQDAVEAAVKVAQGVALPSMPRAMGRVLIPVHFEGDPPAGPVAPAPAPR